LRTRISTEGARADWKSRYIETNAQIERELSERLAGVLPTAEADAVARALTLPMK
jgi:hypothetical protein